jgi:hypothetical protein
MLIPFYNLSLKHIGYFQRSKQELELSRLGNNRDFGEEG